MIQPHEAVDNGNGHLPGLLTKKDEQYLIKLVLGMRLGALAENLNTVNFDEEIKRILGQFQISTKSQARLIEDISKFLNLTESAYRSFPSSDLCLPLEAGVVLENWLKKSSPDVLIEKHRNRYDLTGNQTETPTYLLVNGEKIWERATFLLLFRSEPLIMRMRTYDGENFDCEIKGLSADKFGEELKKRSYAYVRRRLRGKILDQDRKPVKIKQYSRSQLIYPPNLEKSVDELISTFHNWCTSKSVPRWGYFLIGKPGTGKTTIGGLVAQLRPKNCTFLYCPAAAIKSVESVFQLAEILSPTVLQIDDIDLIARNREERDSAPLTSFLMEKLEGLKIESKIFTILTTNDPASIDPAIINRAGRVGTKLILNNFQDCCDRLLRRYADEFNLPLSDSVIQEVISQNKKETDLTPDEVRNICERLHLKFMHRGQKEAIMTGELSEVVKDVFDAFNNPKFQKSQIKRPRRAIGMRVDVD